MRLDGKPWVGDENLRLVLPRFERVLGQPPADSRWRWNVAGATSILTLRCQQASDRWDQIWPQRHSQTATARVNPVYLEIGVEYGSAFRAISADEKIAVDPAFTLSARSRRLADAKARATHYFETTSDAFFANETAFPSSAASTWP